MFANIVFGFVTLCALGMGLWFSFITLKSIRSYRWPSVNGRITSNDLIPVKKVHGVMIYKSKIKYEYQIGTEQFVGKAMDFLSYDNAGIIKQFTSGKYSIGQKVKVYYNPSKTKEAILENGIKFKYFWPALCGWLFVALVVFAYTYGR